MSKRDELREKRRRSESRNRIIWIGAIVVIALAVVAIFVVPSIINAATPVGAFKTITPDPRPQANGLSMGNPSAPVKIVEYADFQCPVCQEFYQQLEPAIVNNYIKPGKVYFTFTSWPFIGAESTAAAQASLCANEQNKFWDFHDIVFTNQGAENSGALNNKRLTAFAQSLGLDMGKFNSCFSANKYSTQISQDQAAGDQAGVTATPAFMVNGKLVYMNTLTQTIDEALGATK